MIIFAVDDDQDDLDLFVETLAQVDNSIICVTATNGLEALDYLDSDVENPDLIFLDINMPKLNGIDALKAIRAKNEFLRVPIVMFTTSINPLDKQVAEIYNAKYINKPSSYANWINVIRNQVTPQ